MRRDKKISLIVLILVIIGIIFVICKLVGKKGSHTQRLAQIYENLNSNQTYLIEMEQNSSNKIIMAKKGEETIIDQYSKDSETKAESHTTTLVKDNNTYLILHDRQEYYVYEQNNVEQNILTDGIKEIIDKNYTTGEEKVKGKKYYYEEYDGSTMFMITNTLELSEADIKTRFYFDKSGNLTYIKTIYYSQSYDSAVSSGFRDEGIQEYIKGENDIIDEEQLKNPCCEYPFIEWNKKQDRQDY